MKRQISGGRFCKKGGKRDREKINELLSFFFLFQILNFFKNHKEQENEKQSFFTFAICGMFMFIVYVIISFVLFPFSSTCLSILFYLCLFKSCVSNYSSYICFHIFIIIFILNNTLISSNTLLLYLDFCKFLCSFLSKRVGF